jgi:hypothetical protein
LELTGDCLIGDIAIDCEETIPMKSEKTYGSFFGSRPIGVFLNVEMLFASSPTSLVDNSRSFATLAASLPVSFWTFWEGINIATKMVYRYYAPLRGL